MRNLVVCLIILLFGCSCRKETTHQMQLFIKNNTAGKLKVTLFPKSHYMHGDLYDFGDFGSGYNDTTFNIDINDRHCLFISGNLNQKPGALTTLVFDSIIVKPQNDLKTIKFSSKETIGYSSNPFDVNSIWNYEKLNYSEHSSFSTHPIESHDYIFEISNKN